MSKGVHRFAVFVACATFFLIIAGANVTSHDAGLATSDWPLSNGQVFPKMVGNLFWEHGHRLVATAVGLLTIALAVYIQLRERRTWVKRLGWSALGAVVAQGLLGGLTVKLNLPLAVSAAHATLAQLFFLITVSLAVFTSPGWLDTQKLTIDHDHSAPLRPMCVASLAVILTQLLLVAHICGAVVVTLVLGTTVALVLSRYRGQAWLAKPATLAAVLLVVQLGLGLAAYITRMRSPYDPQPLNPMIAVTVAHVACGALVFAAAIVMTLRVFRSVHPGRNEYELAPA